ncbi:lipoprotein-releasing ABC transporter permease subunit [Coralloluteibacterium stylophorae]|uniref:Lipoprotein-releasing ABC transporter permease subunit n=1 Tax=Coralloluteibacterium stylophorae TaxID=1776034 RepID=A0AAP2FYQ6_9GAMM|nr:lipoprotein-releasing ABC transporter permease subunit [Coralloluteibacterium stylophorae]MBS7455821.1 lipoprotein-releasing ABC transporter permease subunit [Coralloluteibacterium stylophorae]
MFRPLSLAIGLRYTRAKRRTGFISFISAVSVLGIAVGVIALITTISVMSGFTGEFRDRLLSMVAHATISGAGDAMADWQQAVDVAHRDPRVTGAAPYVELTGLINGRRAEGAVIRGIEPSLEPEVSVVAEKMKAGALADLQPGEFNIVLGRELSQWLAVDVGDRVNVLIPQGSVTPVGFVPRSKAFRVSGIFEVGMQEYDRGMAIVNIADAQRLARLGDDVTGVRLRLDDIFGAWRVARDLADELPGIYAVSDWSRDHANMFRAFKLEKTMMFIIMSLIVGVAAFNLVSSLVMVVTEKQADIAILRTLGVSPGTVMRIFMVQGMLIGVFGVALGVVGGVLLTLNLGHLVHLIEATFGIEVMPSDVYYITGVPTDLDWNEVALIGGIAFLMCLLATLYPAWRASRTDPATALRYE